jgi:hypothetical protein
MKYFRFTAGTPYCGTEEEKYLAFPDGVTEEELEEYAKKWHIIKASLSST